jgi:hypothetical protein
MTKEQKRERNRVAAKKWRDANPERAREIARRSREKYKDVYKARYAPRQSAYAKKYRASLTLDERRDRDLRKKYGITLADYTRMWTQQLGLCAICDVPLETRRPHVDHDHDTGVVRAILCQHCNQAIGMIFESPYLAGRLASYLRKHGKLG